LTKSEARVKSSIHVGPMHVEFALKTFRRSWGRRCLGHWIIYLDPTIHLAHDLLGFLLRRWSSGGIALASPSPGRPGTMSPLKPGTGETKLSRACKLCVQSMSNHEGIYELCL
jgi:hypothetical protein